MTQVITKIYKTSYKHKEIIFITLISAILLSFFAYVFLLQKAILNVVDRSKVSKEASLVSLDVNDLEEKYFSLKNDITIELAHAKGLRNKEVTSYISKKSLTAMVLNNEL